MNKWNFECDGFQLLRECRGFVCGRVLSADADTPCGRGYFAMQNTPRLWQTAVCGRSLKGKAIS
jgi:hypothetical protein